MVNTRIQCNAMQWYEVQARYYFSMHTFMLNLWINHCTNMSVRMNIKKSCNHFSKCKRMHPFNMQPQRQSLWNYFLLNYKYLDLEEKNKRNINVWRLLIIADCWHGILLVCLGFKVVFVFTISCHSLLS